MQAGGIRFENITKSYPSRTGEPTTVLQNLNLHIPAGQITVFVGPSGCGKTTSLRMINRMVEPNSGTITIDGVNVHEKNPYELRRGIGYVMQQGGLMPHRTVAQNIATVPRLLGASRKEAQARALELLNVVGLDSSYAKRYPSQLSGGQVQRVGVARARRRCARPADGRAVLRGGSGGAYRPTERAAAPTGATRQDDRVRHPRH